MRSILFDLHYHDLDFVAALFRALFSAAPGAGTEVPGSTAMQVLLHLIECGKLAPSEFVDLCALQLRRQEPIGRLALRQRVLTMGQIFKIIDMQSSDDRPFGEIAIALGFLTRQRLRSLLDQQQKLRPSLQALALEKGLITDRELLEARRALRRALLAHEPAPGDALSGAVPPNRTKPSRQVRATESLT